MTSSSQIDTIANVLRVYEFVIYLARVLISHSSSTDHVVSDGLGRHGGGAGLLGHHGQLHLLQDVRGKSSLTVDPGILPVEVV